MRYEPSCFDDGSGTEPAKELCRSLSLARRAPWAQSVYISGGTISIVLGYTGKSGWALPDVRCWIELLEPQINEI